MKEDIIIQVDENIFTSLWKITNGDEILRIKMENWKKLKIMKEEWRLWKDMEN